MGGWFEIHLWKRVLGGLALGIAVGLAVFYLGGPGARGFVETWIAPFGEAFVRLIRMLIVPLIFTTLVAGVIAMGDPKRLGSLGGRAIGLYFVTTGIAVTIGLLVGSIIRPGRLLNAESFAGAAAADQDSIRGKLEAGEAAGGIGERLMGIIPENPVAALANADVLAVIFFAILFGVGILLAGEKGEPIGRGIESAAEAMMKLTELVMETAPVGVFALITTVMATQGLEVLFSLGLLAIALYAACALHILLTYGGLVKLVLGLPLMPFYRGVADAQAVAYSTASSSATLPVTITCARENLGVDKSVASSVLPLGATINMDGTSIYLGLVALFAAQALGLELSVASYVMIALTATLTSIGAAGIPSAGLLLATIVLEQIGVTTEQAVLIIAFIFPFDRLLDMMRTLTNVTGDTSVATSVAKWEGELDEAVFRAPDLY